MEIIISIEGNKSSDKGGTKVLIEGNNFLQRGTKL
jgi:hypothetical protein